MSSQRQQPVRMTTAPEARARNGALAPPKWWDEVATEYSAHAAACHDPRRRDYRNEPTDRGPCYTIILYYDC